jgi:signal transduction histidine kinase
VIAAASLPTLVTPRPALEQVLRNLVENAVKHHDRTAGTIEVSAADRGTEVEFAVADDGPGIPEGSREKVFQMFHRIQQDDRPGAGIGLALAKRIVELHGGRIWIEPRAGRGTTVRFTWPRAAGAPEEEHGPRSDRG